MKSILLLFAFTIAFSFAAAAQTYNDATLRRVTLQDQTSRDASGKLLTLSAAEHAYRADVYSSNRHFAEAREHWQKILDFYSTDATVMPKTLFGTARSYMWERQYEKAVFYFDRLLKDYISTKEGREGLAFKGASLIRLNKNAEAAAVYQQYTVMFPFGERIETSYLNTIDALRGAKKYDEANLWVDKAVQKFGSLPTTTNALQARVRLEIYRGNYQNAIAAADQLLALRNFSGSMTSADEVKYLKAAALEKLNRKPEAIAVYQSIPDSLNSYFSGLATEKLNVLAPNNVRTIAQVSSNLSNDYPVVYRAELLKYSSSRGLDPRFVLAIMKQESSFRANAKSPAAARGLLQLVYDTAVKYNKQAGFPNFQADDLYQPPVNIALGKRVYRRFEKSVRRTLRSDCREL